MTTKGSVAVRAYHDERYGADEPETTLAYMLADVLHAVRDAGLSVEDVIDAARHTMAGDDEAMGSPEYE